jgi:methionyl-tRNA formyltransferase
MKRVIFVTSAESGKELLEWARPLCDVVLEITDGSKITEFPEYDLGISYLYTHKIPMSEFDIPYKWVNFHPAPLPERRGCQPYYHAIMDGDATFGSSIHYMDAEFDTGEIIEVIRFPIKPEYTAGDLIHISREQSKHLFKKHIPNILNQKVESFPQIQDGKYYKKVDINDMFGVTEMQGRRIRATTVFPHYYPIIMINNRKYQIAPMEELFPSPQILNKT